MAELTVTAGPESGVPFSTRFRAIMTAREPDADLARLEVPLTQIVDHRFHDVHGRPLPLLNRFEFGALSHSRGDTQPG